MKIKAAYDQLIEILHEEMMNLDLLYGVDSCDTELSERNEILFQKLGQALYAWGYSLEDQIIVEDKEARLEYEKEMEDFTDPDKDHKADVEYIRSHRD